MAGQDKEYHLYILERKVKENIYFSFIEFLSVTRSSRRVIMIMTEFN